MSLDRKAFSMFCHFLQCEQAFYYLPNPLYGKFFLLYQFWSQHDIRDFYPFNNSLPTLSLPTTIVTKILSFGGVSKTLSL